MIMEMKTLSKITMGLIITNKIIMDKKIICRMIKWQIIRRIFIQIIHRIIMWRTTMTRKRKILLKIMEIKQ